MNTKQYYIAFGFLLALFCDLMAWYILKLDNERFLVLLLFIVIGIVFTYYKSKTQSGMAI